MRSAYDRTILVASAVVAIFLAIGDIRFCVEKPLGGDFAQVWLAGMLVDRGAFATLYDPLAFSRAGQALIDLFYHPKAYWSYPPTTLLIGWPVAQLPYPVALFLFSAVQVVLAAVTGAYLARARGPRLWGAAIMLTSPALIFSLICGQFSAPVGCLLVFGVFTLRTRPVLAGILFALVVMKPQFGLLVPVALLAAGEWIALISAAGATLSLAALAALIFGTDMWFDFVTKTLPQQAEIVGDLANYGLVAHSVRDTLLLAGAPRPFATAMQVTAATMAVSATAYTFWKTREPYLRAFVLTLSAALLLPYANIYDAAIPAIGAMALYGSQERLRPAMLAALAVIWTAPAVDAVLSAHSLFKFAPVFEIAVLAAVTWNGSTTEFTRKRRAPKGELSVAT